jgi:hypothetical protein
LQHRQHQAAGQIGGKPLIKFHPITERTQL